MNSLEGLIVLIIKVALLILVVWFLLAVVARVL